MRGKTQYMHMEHWVRGKYNMDYLIPLARIFWEEEPTQVLSFNQRQSFYDGTIQTHFETPEYAIRVTSWFDPVVRNLTGFKFEVSGQCPQIILAPFQELDVHYDQNLKARFSSTIQDQVWRATLECLNVKTSLVVWTDAEIETCREGLKIQLRPGRSNILISVNDEPVQDTDVSLDRTREWWHAEWKGGTQLDIPDEEAQKMWVRSMAYILCSYNDDALGMAGPMGLTGNGWPFAFPQDLSFIHPALLATGHLDIARSWIEYWAGHLDGMREYTQRLLGVDGILAPWVFPYGSFTDFHNAGTPNKCYYEIHNSGYLCRMAFETSVAVDDPEWTTTFAIPLIRETAYFYLDVLKKGEDALWHIDITPSMGQDEMGGRNQKDYLCALYSAQYCLQVAIELGLDESGQMGIILRDGIAFETLLSPKGFYYTCAGSGAEDFGRQKHPPQLNPLAYLPLSSDVLKPTKSAYDQRYSITERSAEPFFHGWTLGEFLLASTRMGNAVGWRKDWNNARASDYVDEEWIQIFETSGAHQSSFYVTTHGLFAQATMECFVSAWWGKLQAGHCMPWSSECSFSGMVMLLGVEASGHITPEYTNLILKAQRDTTFRFQKQDIAMRVGEKRSFTLPHLNIPTEGGRQSPERYL